MKKIILPIILVLFFINAGAQNTKVSAANDRSDSIDILNYTINLNITDFTNKKISGNTEITFVPKLNGISNLSLDLLKLTVDSIVLNDTLKLGYSYNDTLLVTALPNLINIGDTNKVAVYYQGAPKTDAQWGGFYFQGNYAYNMGVGFSAIPHNFGRVWFPCFDNFVERSTYEFNITTNSGKIAYCNGFLAKDTTDALGNRTRKWKMDQTIPSYLACVAVAPYTQVNDTYYGLDTIPIEIAALPADTNNLKNSFIHLKNAMAAYENSYGPYKWNKIGYSLVPFAAGAMEHATNIAYPQSFANGALTYETVMAHELSHHWWGDLATCETAEDMWLNEGMAVFSEFIFTENVYGKDAYKASIRTLHENILHYAHIKEGGYRAISGIPQLYTYGQHVYNKGADVARTLRSYLGDTAFFNGLKYHLTNKQFTDVNSSGFRDNLTAATGVNMNDFFNDWVFNPGFPHFSIDSFNVIPNGGQFDVTVYIKQKLTGAPSFYNSVPLEITFKDSAWATQTEKVIINGEYSNFTFSIPIKPVYVALNLDEKIADAIAPDYKTLKNTGTFYFSNARMTITVQSISDSAFIRVEHNFNKPDAIKNQVSPYCRLSPNRYWKVDGILPSTFDATAKIIYDGRTNLAYSSSHLDNYLITAREDSLVLMYRKNAGDDWRIFPYSTKFPGTLTDKTGYFMIDSLLLGEYTFAMKDIATGKLEQTGHKNELKIYPNPANTELHIELQNNNEAYRLKVRDILGREINVEQIYAGKGLTLSTEKLTNGIYFIEAIGKKASSTGKFTVLH